MVFKPSDELSEQDKEDKKENHSGKKAKGVYINGKPVDNIDINILGTIIICFGLLVAISAYDTYLLEITHTCSDDAAIYCFPDYADTTDPDNPISTIISQLFQPIDNCSFWTHPSIATKVTFTCYNYAFNAKDALVVTGAMLAFFVIAMRIIKSTILFTVRYLRNKGCNKCLTCMRVVAVILLLVIDFGVALVVMVFHLAKDFNLIALLDNNNEFPTVHQGAVYVSDHGVQFLIIVGTTTLLLLVNWKKYVKVDAKLKVDEVDKDSVQLDIGSATADKKNQV